MGEESADFRGLYRLFSARTRSTLLAFYQMSDGRGCGVENSIDKGEMSVARQMASSFLERAIAEMLKLFPEAEQRESVAQRRISRCKP
jgi:hypothetical protein